MSQPNVELKPGYLTTEFYATITIGLTNLIFMLWMAGVVTAEEKDQYTALLTTSISAAEILITNMFLLWSYLSSRYKTKKAVLEYYTTVASIPADPVITGIDEESIARLQAPRKTIRI